MRGGAQAYHLRAQANQTVVTIMGDVTQGYVN